MTEIVVLSDSNDSVLSVEPIDELKSVEKKKKKEKKHSPGDSDSSDFEFPEVKFSHAIDEDNVFRLKNNEISLPIVNSQASSSRTNKCIVTNKNSKQRNVQKCSDASASTTDEENGIVRREKSDGRLTKKTKNQLTEERLKRQKQLTRERALKSIAAKKLKNLSPGECMKFIEVILDKGIESFTFVNNIVNTLIDASLQYSINKELISNSITWKRIIENGYLNEANEICTVTNVERVNQMLIIWNWDEAVTKVADNTFCTSILSIKSTLDPDCRIILVIFGIDDYFTHRRNERNSNKSRAKNRTQKSGTKSDVEFKNFPEISRAQLETCLNEIQVIAGCNSRIINNSEDLASMIYQCTKAIAETPYKLKKNTDLTNKFDWYVMGDNRNTVRVDKDGNGLKRLWQQQLCQFNLSSLEIAEAICCIYPSPMDLIEAYMNCTDDSGTHLLKNIPIRRAAGPLTAIRRVGPELSKRIHLMFTSKDGENVLC
ncbi:methyl methanesulfonate sensitivity 4 [Xylocopa sonorina]|uniref:methyl methanesulfonate sensitivity 4 n=1 Tax=Xylocopa sonorina TaxID=1818115 RepID=UPI00403B30B0